MAVRVIFLDRDGVINRSPGEGMYVASQRQFRFLPNAKRAIRALSDAGFAVAIVSNQSGVSRGVMTRAALDELTRWMVEEIRLAGGVVAAVRYCVHRDEDHCACRKPKAGLLQAAARGLLVDWEGSFLIGDAKIDIEAGRRAGCRTVLVLSGRTQASEIGAWRQPPDQVAKDLWDAARMILHEDADHHR